MKDILIIAHFTQVPGEKGNGRFHYIANMLSDEGMNVEVVTTQFSHRTKRMRKVSKCQLKNLKYKLTMLEEPGYEKNVSLKRFYSHYIMGKNVKKYIKHRKKPDIIYCAVPSLDVANEVSKYAEKYNVNLIIDIQDIWPEAFKMIFNIPILSDLIFKPMERVANNIYKRADWIIGVSKTYSDRALKVNSKVNKGLSVFLGTELKYFDEICDYDRIQKPQDEVWIIYIGTLGHSYDLTIVMEALAKVKNLGINNLRFMVLGDGPLRKKFENDAKRLNIDVEFTGNLDYEEMVRYLKVSDIAINPITKGAAQSIVNKVGDYAAAGIPVINTQECKEYRELIEKYNCGLNCINNDVNDLSDKIIYLYNNKTIREDLGKNNRILAEQKFDREKTYKEILDLIKIT